MIKGSSIIFSNVSGCVPATIRVAWLGLWLIAMMEDQLSNMLDMFPSGQTGIQIGHDEMQICCRVEVVGFTLFEDCDPRDCLRESKSTR